MFLRGFIQDLDQEIETAYLSLITSKMEGFNLGLLETIAKGILLLAMIQSMALQI